VSSGMLYNHIDIFFGHGLGQGQVVGYCVCGNELLYSITCKEFFGQLRNC